MIKNNPKIKFYSFFTQFSLKDDYRFGLGVFSRIVRKVLPEVPPRDTFEFVLLKQDKDITEVLKSFDFETIGDSHISQELLLSIKALCFKISAFGLDNEIKRKFQILKLDHAPFETLQQDVGVMDSRGDKALLSTLKTIEDNILALRKNKKVLGVNLHLTIVSRGILEYIDRVRDLLELRSNIDSEASWEAIINKYMRYTKEKNSLRRYIVRYFDLLVLEVVEHTSNAGESYIAESYKEYGQFLFRSLLGGAIIALFSLFKIFLGQEDLSSYRFALFASLSYAACFILVKRVGGIIATKQPAMTASTIARHIDKKDDLKIGSIKEVVSVIKKALGSQFISLVGNFFAALLFAGLIYKGFELAGWHSHLGIKADYLIQDALPSFNLVVYAAITGIFLALSGLISGYVDNKVIASNLPYRMVHSRVLPFRHKLAQLICAKGGSFVGNLSLGFFLGGAFLLSNILPFSVDIRHIAFSTSNVAYAMMSKTFDGEILLKVFLGVGVIGFINFIVSFSITLLMALKSRGAKFSLLRKLIAHSIRDFIRHPLDYLIVRDGRRHFKRKKNSH